MGSRVADAHQFLRPCAIINGEFSAKNCIPLPVNEPQAICHVQRINQFRIASGVRQVPALVAQYGQNLLPPVIMEDTLHFASNIACHLRMQDTKSFLDKFVIFPHSSSLLFVRHEILILRDAFPRKIFFRFLRDNLQGVMDAHIRAGGVHNTCITGIDT